MGNFIFKQMHGLKRGETNEQVSEDCLIRFSSLVDSIYRRVPVRGPKWQFPDS